MSGPDLDDLEERLRRLRLAGPPAALAGKTLALSASLLRLRRRFRMALAGMAASMVLAVAAGRLGGPGPSLPEARPALDLPP